LATLTPEQWESVEKHFHALNEIPPEHRARVLAAIDDPMVREEVASLLANSGGNITVASVIGSMAGEVADQISPEELGSIAGRRIGPYRLVRRLGQGGQGTVFEAARDDGTFHQRVAIKVVKWDMDTAPARDRFRRERQMLAALEHPYIARLLDGGEAEDGTPYLVMEFVEGKTLTIAAWDWPRERKLNLFLEIADAVAYAHRNLIVHRDLKPANILVSVDGHPKLLDFGVAKLVDTDPEHTATAMQALTPAYASPEQVLGEPITTACDVYSLGVVLYELLTGSRPYDLPTHSALEIHKAICLTEPAPPKLGDELDHPRSWPCGRNRLAAINPSRILAKTSNVS
jgi:serine/threonine protein kinase